MFKDNYFELFKNNSEDDKRFISTASYRRLPSKQNFYPDLTFKDKEGNLFAVDFKSSYYDGESVNGLTLGSYWGYFRERDTIKSMDHTYNSYSSHTVLGMLYIF